MVRTDSNQAASPKRYDTEQLKAIHPRLCLLHKWSHYDGYGIHLTCNGTWRGLHIDEIESNSPAESGGLLRQDIILAVNGRSIENEDFFVILSFIQHELEQDQICFLVLDPYGAELAQRNQINIDEKHQNCLRKESAKSIESSEKVKPVMAPNSSDAELRMCSITLRPGSEPIGISLQSDTDFSHIITQVRSNSPAARAGIEQDDCILFLNNTSLLHIPFEDVLFFLAQSRNEPKLNFLVAKKPYLLQSFRNYLTPNTPDQLLSSGRLVERNRSSTLPATETSERMYHKSTYEQTRKTQQRETTINEQYDRLSLQIYSNMNIIKRKKRYGKILEGIGPATALQSSWSARSEKTNDYSSIRSDLHNQNIGTDEIDERPNTLTDLLTSLQVGMTNPSPKQRTRRIPMRLASVNFSDDRQRTAQSPALCIGEQG